MRRPTPLSIIAPNPPEPPTRREVMNAARDAIQEARTVISECGLVESPEMIRVAMEAISRGEMLAMHRRIQASMAAEVATPTAPPTSQA